MNRDKMLHFPDIFETLLSSRGIGKDHLDTFINPDYDKLHDPFLLRDMQKASERVVEAVNKKEHIVVYSDYDADGIPGAVVLSDFFRRIKYDNVSFYIPHRHDEGFGLNMSAIEECVGRGAKLMITVDCGISGVEEVARAGELGMDVVITDHHEPSSVLPEAFAIVNPKLPDSKYPFKELCGAGVAYKLVQALYQTESFGVKEGMEKWSLDMVAIATLSDCVPLIGENRILSRFGLDVLRKSPRPGLLALLERLRIDRRFINEDDIAFMVTPRINAASRMGVPEDAFKLLSTTDESEARRLALHLETINNERKGVVASMVKEAKRRLATREEVSSVIVLGNPEWRPALLGLVANSLVEEYERPVFVWGRDGEGVLKGSCRSYNGYDLYTLMDASRELFIEYGGHTGAGGFSITLENLPKLEETLSENLTQLTQGKEESGVTLPVTLSDIGEKLWSTISLFSPFGTGNPKPVLKIDCEVTEVRKFGKEGNHLELKLANGVKAISFFSTSETYQIMSTPASVTLYANLEKSFFMNRPEIRLRIVDIQT